MSSRLIFHSESSNNLQELSIKLLSNLFQNDWEIADLNWINLEEWREALKAIFNSPEDLAHLRQINEMTLKFCSSPSEYFCHNHFQVHYMHCWLAAQLGWEFSSYKCEEHKKTISYSKGGQPIKVHILEEACGIKALPGSIMYLQIKTLNKKSFTFHTTSENDMIHIEILDEQKSKKPYNTALIKSKWELHLAKEICYKETSSHYVNMLKKLSEIDGLV